MLPSMAISEMDNQENFLWQNESWNFSNSDNSENLEHRTNKKPLDLSANGEVALEKEETLVLSKKRGREKPMVDKNKNSKEPAKAKEVGESDHEMHIWTERERRKKMRNMFANLHALLPQLAPKADKSTIVDEAINYIKTLQHTLQRLEKQKLERIHGATTFTYGQSSITAQKLSYDQSREAFLANQGASNNNLMSISTASSSNSSPIFCNNPIVFQTWSSPNVTLNICGDEAHINVCSLKKPGLFSTICCILEKYKIQVICAHISSDQTRSLYMIQANASNTLDQMIGVFTIEEVYKQAAGEIMTWVSS